jgi:hypothetical protein
VLPHALVDLRQKEHILRGVLEQLRRQRPLGVPKIGVLQHQLVHAVLLRVLSLGAKIVEQQIIK